MPNRCKSYFGGIKMEQFKSGFVSLIGRTNAGKSTLLNALIGENIAIVTSKPQTTRTAIKGIVNRTNSQIIFMDTPGIHEAKTKFNQSMLTTAYHTIQDADVILFIVDAGYAKISEDSQKIIEKLKEQNSPVILVLNKMDEVKKEQILHLMDLYRQAYPFASIIPITAKKKKNLENLLEEIEKNLPNGQPYYDQDEYTDQTERQLVEEVVREKCLKLLNDEVPHGIYVKVEEMKLKKMKNGKDFYDIQLVIYCERNSHKGIIIGKNGSMLKKIASYAREKIEAMLGIKVNMRVWVKVSEDWKKKLNVDQMNQLS